MVIGVEIPQGIPDVVDNKLDRDCVSYGRFAFKHAAEQNHRSEHSRGAIERYRGGRTAAARICGIAHSQSSGAEQNGPSALAAGSWIRDMRGPSMLTKCPVFATPARHHVERRGPDGSRLVTDRAMSERFVVYLPRRVAEFGAGHRAGLWYCDLSPRSANCARSAVGSVGSCRRAGIAEVGNWQAGRDLPRLALPAGLSVSFGHDPTRYQRFAQSSQWRGAVGPAFDETPGIGCGPRSRRSPYKEMKHESSQHSGMQAHRRAIASRGDG